jgi:hypothetical protein
LPRWFSANGCTENPSLQNKDCWFPKESREQTSDIRGFRRVYLVEKTSSRMKLKALCLFVIVVVGSLELSSTEVIVASYYGGCSPTLTCGTASISSGSLLIYNRTGIAQSFIPNYTCNLTAIHVYLDTGSGSKEITFSIRTEPSK